MEVNSTYWGDSSSWIAQANGDYKTSPYAIRDQYMYENPGETWQVFGEPIDTSPAFWGWKNDCSWATKHQRSINSGVIQDVSCQPEDCSPVMGWDYKSSQYGAWSVYYHVEPNARFNYDTIGDYGEYANYTKAEAFAGFGDYAPSVPWTDMKWAGWCGLPYVILFKIENDEFVQYTTDMTLAGIDSLGKNLLTLLGEGWKPMMIYFDTLYHGNAEGLAPRSQLGMSQSIRPLIEGMSDIKMTQDVYTWYSTNHKLYYDPDSDYYIQPDYGYDLAIGQAPATPYAHGSWLNFTSQNYINPEAIFCGSQRLGACVTSTYGAYNNGLKCFQYKASETVQHFDALSYHWETKVHMDGTDPTDTVYNYTELVVDSKDNGQTDAQAMYEAILHECAFFGLKFANTSTKAINANLTSTGDGIGLYMPVFTEQYHTTGLYKTGDDFINDDNVDKDARDFDFSPETSDDEPDTPDEPGEPGEDGERKGDWTYTNGNLVIDARNYHVANVATYWNFMTWAKAGAVGSDTTWYSNLDYHGINASDWIICVKQFPFSIPHYASNPQTDTLTVGGVTITDSNDNPLSAPLLSYGTSTCTFNLGKITINEALFTTTTAGNFLSYQYGQLFLRLPFYGDFEIDMGRYWGAELKVEATIDYPNGVGTYYIYSAGVVFDSLDFNVGVDLPVSALAMGTYQNSMHSYTVQKERIDRGEIYNAFSLVGNLAGGNVMGALTPATNIIEAEIEKKNIDWTMQHTKPRPGSYLSTSGFNNVRQDLAVKLIRYQPRLAPDYNKATYGKMIGFACVKQGKLGKFKGYTVCSNADLSSISATQTEKAMLMDLLQNGVYIN